MKETILTISIAAILFATQGTANAQNFASQLNADIYSLQKQWAHIKYEPQNLKDSDEDVQEDAMEELAQKAEKISAKYQNKAEPKIWEAIIISTEAGIKGGLSALSLVKKSKKLLEQAKKIDPNALNGSIYTSLGSLYYKVPGWPLGFGDDDKARAYLQKALAINPNGIDPNFFYGDFLIEEGKYEQAIKVLKHALKSTPRPNRPIADAGRRKEIQADLAKARKKL